MFCRSTYLFLTYYFLSSIWIMTMMGYFPSSVDNDVRLDVSSIVLRFFVSNNSKIMSYRFFNSCSTYCFSSSLNFIHWYLLLVVPQWSLKPHWIIPLCPWSYVLMACMAPGSNVLFGHHGLDTRLFYPDILGLVICRCLWLLVHSMGLYLFMNLL